MVSWRRLVVVVLVTVVWAAVRGVEAAAAGETVPIVANDVAVTSLHRAAEDWNVRTTFWLKATDGGGRAVPATFAVAPLPPGDGELTCGGNGRCTFVPAVGRVGRIRVTYTATCNVSAVCGSLSSAPAVVDINIQERGLRWELLTNGSTGLSNDSGSGAAAKSAFGGTAPDFSLVLTWQADYPKRKAAGGNVARGQALEAVATRGSWATNAVFRVGLETIPVGVEATSLTARPAGPSETGAGETAQAVASQRVFSVGSEIDRQWVSDPDGRGVFYAIGLLGRGFLDTALTSEQLKGDAQDVVQLVLAKRSAVRVDLGMRFVLKQRHAPSSQASTMVGQVGRAWIEQLEVVDDLLALDVFVQRNTAYGRLAVDGPVNRWGIRFIAQPKEIRSMSVHARGMVGIEATRSWSGGAWVAKVMYGVNFIKAGG